MNFQAAQRAYSRFKPGQPHTSYSGADCRFWMHVPVDVSLAHRQQLVLEIQDEIWEIEKRIRDYQAGQGNGQIDIWNSGTIVDAYQGGSYYQSLVATLNKLKKAKQRIMEDKRSIRSIELNTIQTLSYQAHNDRQAVRALGHTWPKGYTHGPRLVAGSIIFTMFREHPLTEVIDTYNQGNNPLADLGLSRFNHKSSARGQHYDLVQSSAVPDQLPPLHISCLAVNEMGNAASMTIYGVHFINDGQVMSIQDILTENTLSFVAFDYDPMRTLDTRGLLNMPAIDRIATVTSLLSSPVASARRARRSLPFGN